MSGSARWPAPPARARSVPVHMSASIQPYLLAALVEAPDGLAGRPVLVVAADDIGARDLARELRAYLAPRRVRYYPSRGTGYASHVAPPPHLVGLRIAALDALTDSDPAVVVASAVALAEAVPDAALRPAGFTLERGSEVDLGEVADLLVEAGYERIDQVEERGQFAVRGGILDVFGATEDRAARLELFGDEIESIRWFSTFTQRSLGEADRVELSPAAELASEHRELAELALEDDPERPDLERAAAAGELPRAARADPLRGGGDHHRRRGDSDRAPRPLGRRHDGDPRRRRAPPLRRRRRAARRARLAEDPSGSPRTRSRARQADAGLSFRAPGADLRRPQHGRGGVPARAGASLRQSRRGRVRESRRGRAGPLQPQPARRPVPG